MPNRLHKYIALGKLGEGGFGEVYLAKDPDLGRKVAIKVIRSDRASNENAQKRFFREAKAIANLDHPAIVKIHSMTRNERDQLIVMEYIHGASLAKVIDEGPISAANTVSILRQISTGLDHAHKNGIIHRDLKAENVMLSTEGQVKILDFGLAKNLASSETSLTHGHIVGTLYALSPEQASVKKDIDHRSDIFSLGGLAYHMLVGQPPFLESDTNTTLLRILGHIQKPASEINPEIPTPLSELVDWMLEKNRDSRPQTALAVAERLEELAKLQKLSSTDETLRPIKDITQRIADSQKTTLPLDSPFHHIPEKTSRRKAHLAPWGLILVVLLISTLLVWQWWTKPPPTLAIGGFQDLSSETGASWVTAALSEILAVEIASDGLVQVVSENRMTEIQNELGLVTSETLTAENLERLKLNLRADYVAVGSYQPRRSPEEPQQLHLELQDFDDGEIVWQTTLVGSDDDVFNLAADASDGLRTRLGIKALATEQRSETRTLFPANTEAARLYFQGRGQLRRIELAEARESLEHSEELEPEHPRTLTALAAVLLQLEELDEAAHKSALAATEAASWPLAARLEIEGRSYQIEGNWEQAAKTYRELFRDSPDIDDGIRLVEMQLEAGDSKAATQTLKELRKLRLSDRSKALVAFYDARASYDLGMLPEARLAAEQAMATADRIGAGFLAARSRLALGDVLHELYEYRGAIAALQQAREDFEQAQYLIGAQRAFHLIALSHIKLDELPQAVADLDRFIKYFKHAPEAFGAIRHLCNATTDLGYHTTAEALLTRALELMRPLQPYEEADASLVFGFINQIVGDLDEAEAKYKAAWQTFREITDHESMAFASTNLGEVYFLKGDLKEALSSHRSALEVNRNLPNAKEGAAYDQYRIGRVFAVRGDETGAMSSYQAALTELQELNPRGSDVAKIMLAQAETELYSRQNFGEAAALAESAAEIFRAAEMIDYVIEAEALSVKTLLLQGQVDAARKRTLTLLGAIDRSEAWLARFKVRALDAQLRAESREPEDVEAALSRLEQLTLEARQKSFLGQAFETRFAQAEIEILTGRHRDAEARLAILVEDAQNLGYGQIVQRANKLLRL